MNKTLKVVAVAIAFAATVSTVAAAFNTNLTVGSTGPDVAALQSWLIGKGFSIPAISSGVATPGYFGSQTKAAVVAYQASVGLPNTGFVGPLTRGMLNGAGVPTTPGVVVCPVGFTCTPIPGTTPATPAGPVVMDGTDGSLTASLSSYASNVTIKKGETKDLVAVKLQATAGPVSVTRFDVRMNNRPWLYFSQITLKDTNGTVIATKNLSSQADATEITVGTDYLVRFEGINAVVTPGTDRTIVVSGSVLSATDKLSSDVSIIVSIPDNSIRTVNGKGYTDSIGLGTVAVSGTSGRTATLSSSGSTGNILVKLSPSSPAQGIVNTSTSGETNGVVLGRFDFKSENRSSQINTLTFTLKKSGGDDFSTMFKRVYLTDGTTKYNVDSVATSSVFSNLTIDLPQDTWKTLTLTADVADQDDFTNGRMASTTITVNNTNIVGVDSNFTTVTATGANAVTSNDLTFLASGASISGIVNPVVVTNVDNGSSAVVKKTFGFTFTFNNTGTNDLFVSKDGNIALGTTTTFAATTTQPWANTVVGPATVSGDTSTMYVIPAGSSRTFTYQSTIDTTRDNSTKTGTVKISAVYFTDLTNIATPRTYSITFGLENLTTPLVAF